MARKQKIPYPLKHVCSIFSQMHWFPEAVYAFDPDHIDHWFLKLIWRFVILFRGPMAAISPMCAEWQERWKYSRNIQPMPLAEIEAQQQIVADYIEKIKKEIECKL